MLKTVQSYIRPGRVSFFLCLCTCSLLSLALHLQSAHVSYAGDCLVAPANISALRCSTFACAWQVGASQSVSRKPSKPKQKEAHAVDPPAKGPPSFAKESCRYCVFLFSPPHVWKEKWLKTQRCSASHARDRWEFRNPCLVRDRTETERKNVRSLALDPSTFFRDEAT